MAEIPKDIEEAAWKVAGSCGDDYYHPHIFEAAVKALLAERERGEQAEIDEWENIKQIALENMLKPKERYEIGDPPGDV